MRWLPLVLAGCAATPTATVTSPARKAEDPPVEPFWSKRPAVPEDSPLVALATARTLYLIATEEFGHECRAWRVEQSKRPDDDTAFLVEPGILGAERIGFINHGARLELVSRTRTTKYATESTPCAAIFNVRELDDGLDVDGARWFANHDDCQRALDDKVPVATDLGTCAWKPAANLQEQAAAQRRFEAILRFGGTLFGVAGDACQPVRAEAARTNTASSFTGNLWHDLRDGTRRGKSGYGYMMQANALTIGLTGPHGMWSDGSSLGLLCGDDRAISYGKDSVELEQTMYLSAASCRAALARERTRRSRLPSANDDDPRELSAFATPRLGGC